MPVLPKSFLIVLLFMIGACGFSPIYGTKAPGEPSVQESLGTVAIENISGEHGQFLRNKLMDRMHFRGRPSDPQASLVVHLAASEASLGIRKDATTTRSQLTVRADYRLLAADGRTILTKGGVTSVASYSKLDAQYGTVTTQRDSYRRALTDISEQITNRLSLYYAERAPTVRSSSGYLSETVAQ